MMRSIKVAGLAVAVQQCGNSKLSIFELCDCKNQICECRHPDISDSQDHDKEIQELRGKLAKLNNQLNIKQKNIAILLKSKEQDTKRTIPLKAKDITINGIKSSNVLEYDFKVKSKNMINKTKKFDIESQSDKVVLGSIKNSYRLDNKIYVVKPVTNIGESSIGWAYDYQNQLDASFCVQVGSINDIGKLTELIEFISRNNLFQNIHIFVSPQAISLEEKPKLLDMLIRLALDTFVTSLMKCCTHQQVEIRGVNNMRKGLCKASAMDNNKLDSKKIDKQENIDLKNLISDLCYHDLSKQEASKKIEKLEKMIFHISEQKDNLWAIEKLIDLFEYCDNDKLLASCFKPIKLFIEAAEALSSIRKKDFSPVLYDMTQKMERAGLSNATLNDRYIGLNIKKFLSSEEKGGIQLHLNTENIAIIERDQVDLSASVRMLPIPQSIENDNVKLENEKIDV